LSLRSEDTSTAAGKYLADRVREGIFEEDDEKIVSAYRGAERLLESMKAFSDEEQRRVALARERMYALAELRGAFSRRHPNEIVRVYLLHADVLEQSRNFSREERQRVVEARRACLLDDLHAAMADYDPFKVEVAGRRAAEEGCILSDADSDALRRARHILVALRQLRQALESDSDTAIVGAYQADLLDDCRRVTAEDRYRIRLAQDRLQRWRPLRNALVRGDDLAMASLYNRLLFDGFEPMSPEQHERCELALKRAAAYERFQQALLSGDAQQIVGEYDEELLGPAALLTPSAKQRVEDARYQVVLTKAWGSGDLTRVADAYCAVVKARVRVPDGVDRETVIEATRAAQLVADFRQALHAADRKDEAIARLGDRLLGLWPDLLTTEDKDEILRSKVKVGARSRLQEAAASGDGQRVAMVLQHVLSLTESSVEADPGAPSAGSEDLGVPSP
jgi:hypothetical protein